MTDLISIITPSYNTCNFIEETIQSVINQSYENWEMIIVDDCSVDNSIEIISSFSDDRIKLLINERNSGAAISRNRALREAKGKWIAFLDSDDLWESQKLEKQVSFMKKNNFNFSYTEYIEVDKAGIPTGKLLTGPKILTEKSFKDYCYPGCLTVMYNRESVGLIQVENLAKNNDYAMWLKVIKKTNCYLLPQSLARYRRRKGSISNHSYIKLIRHHYLLWRIGESKGFFESIILTFRNLFYGFLKKIIYVKEVKIV